MQKTAHLSLFMLIRFSIYAISPVAADRCNLSGKSIVYIIDSSYPQAVSAHHVIIHHVCHLNHRRRGLAKD